MPIIRNWSDVKPGVAHDNAVVWAIFRRLGAEGKTGDDAPLQSLWGFSRHMVQPGKSGDYHAHEDREQIHYFIQGTGKLKLDGELFSVKPGDAAYIPPKMMHQFINDSDDWAEHLIITGEVGST